MTTSHWIRSHSFTTTDMSTDVLIVGGGYIGLSTAFWISEMRPDLKITIIERGQCGAGASGRNAGFLTLGSASFYKGLSKSWGSEKAQSVLKFAQDSLELVRQNILKSSPEIKYDQTASFTLFQTESQFLSWSKDEFDIREFGFSWKQQEEMPLALQGKFFGAYETGPEYKVNPIQLLSSLKKRLESRKVTIMENVMGFELTSDGLKTDVNTIKAKKVVLALNAYLPEFHKIFEQIITPRRAQMLAVELDKDLGCPGLYYDPAERVYWRKTSDKTLVIGGKRLLDAEGEVGNFEKLSPRIQQGLEDYLSQQLELKYKIINRWSGTMGFTEHELPIVSKVNFSNDVYIVGGFSGHGMGLGFRTGMDVAELVTDQKNVSFFSMFKKVDFVL